MVTGSNVDEQNNVWCTKKPEATLLWVSVQITLRWSFVVACVDKQTTRTMAIDNREIQTCPEYHQAECISPMEVIPASCTNGRCIDKKQHIFHLLWAFRCFQLRSLLGPGSIQCALEVCIHASLIVAEFRISTLSTNITNSCPEPVIYSMQPVQTNNSRVERYSPAVKI